MKRQIDLVGWFCLKRWQPFTNEYILHDVMIKYISSRDKKFYILKKIIKIIILR